MYDIIKQDEIMFKPIFPTSSSRDKEKQKKLFQTIGELYIVYIQSKKFLSEDTTLVKHFSIMEEVEKNHAKLKNIFQDLTKLRGYQYNPSDLFGLTKAYYRASSLKLILKNAEKSEWQLNYERYKNPLLRLNYKIEATTNENQKINHYNKLLEECIQDHIDRIQDLETNNSNHDESIIMNSDWLPTLLSNLYHEHPKDTNSYFIDSLNSVGIDKLNNITQTLWKNLDTAEFKTQYIAIGEALFKKDNDAVKNMVESYLKNLKLLCQKKIESDYKKDIESDYKKDIESDYKKDLTDTSSLLLLDF